MTPARFCEIAGAGGAIQEAITQAQNGWRVARAAIMGRLQQRLKPDAETAALLKEVLTAQAEEAALKGFRAGYDYGLTCARTENTRINELLLQAGADNARLRAELHAATTELGTLRATLAGVERVARLKIIASAAYDHPGLPRLAPRSAVIGKHLSHDAHIYRVARRIEELILEQGGAVNKGYLEEHLLPESPAPVFNQAVTHLLLSKRIKQRKSGGYSLRGGADG